MSEPENPAERTQQLPPFTQRLSDSGQLPPVGGHHPGQYPGQFPGQHQQPGPGYPQSGGQPQLPHNGYLPQPGGLDQFFGPAAQAPTQRTRPAPAKRNRGLVLTLQILGLAVVALLAGSLWVACSPTATTAKKATTTAPTGPASASAFTYQEQAQQHDIDCKANSYGKVSDSFATQPCQGLTRWLYTTTSQSGDKIVVALSKVQMADPASAAALQTLSAQEGTGNIGYLVHNGFAVPAGPNRLGKDSGYASNVQGTIVTIAESAFLETDRSDPTLLKQVSSDAITSQGK